MPKRIALALALALLAGGAALLAELRGQPCAQTTAAQGTTKELKWVCPIYCYANYVSYCSYYSEQCKGTYVNLNAKCGIPTDPTRCNAPKDPCVQIELFKKGPGGATLFGRRPPRTHPDLGDGIKKGKPIDDPTKGDGAMHGKLIHGKYHLADLEVQEGKYAKVALYLILTTPPKMGGVQLPARIFGHGIEVEVDGGQKPDFVIPNKDLGDVSGKACTVDLGDVTYQVILDEKTAVMKGPKKQ